MTINWNINAKDALWNFSWDIEDHPVVRFTNPKSCCVMKYTAADLTALVEDQYADYSFIPVPRYVMESALEVYTRTSKKAA